jgi:hypothetical protein
MNGFRCNVTGGDASATAIADPLPPKWCPDGGCVDGPKQPLYWANAEGSNIEYSGEYYEKPSYNMKWGFPDGAQEIAKAGGAASTGTGTTTTTAAASTGAGTTATSATGAAGTTTVTHKNTRLTTVTRTKTMTSSAASSTAEACSWAGHCIGATCVCPLFLNFLLRG